MLTAKGGKADDRIHRCADIVRHIGQKCALGAAGGFGGRNRLGKRLIDLPVSRAVGHHEDVLGPACDLAAHGDDVEPAALTGLLMGIIGVPFALLAALNPREEVLIVVGRILRVQRPQCTDVLLHLLERHAQQPLDIRADIVHAGGFGVHHEENVIHVAREPGEQLIPVQNLGISPTQRVTASVHDERDKQHHKQARDNDHDLDRPAPQRIHAGVNNADRNEPEHDPVLDTHVLVDQIIPGSPQCQHHTAVPALREIVAQRIEFFLGQIELPRSSARRL